MRKKPGTIFGYTNYRIQPLLPRGHDRVEVFAETPEDAAVWYGWVYGGYLQTSSESRGRKLIRAVTRLADRVDVVRARLSGKPLIVRIATHEVGRAEDAKNYAIDIQAIAA